MKVRERIEFILQIEKYIKNIEKDKCFIV